MTPFEYYGSSIICVLATLAAGYLPFPVLRILMALVAVGMGLFAGLHGAKLQ